MGYCLWIIDRLHCLSLQTSGNMKHIHIHLDWLSLGTYLYVDCLDGQILKSILI